MSEPSKEAKARRERMIAASLEEWPQGLRRRLDFVNGVLSRGESLGAAAERERIVAEIKKLSVNTAPSEGVARKLLAELLRRVEDGK